ncbi:tRNA 2-thiouridine(34) synthase MnmA [Patescibacteria group bacterium]|nr:tRNA 2-thiouridine(34) synthase MnmA [Patescibacteria group bacterium]
MASRGRIFVGMSGGVDSSVAAYLLQKQDYEVVGGFMKNWSDGDETSECSWRTERRDAMRVAVHLGIDFHTFDYEDKYRENVYEYMIREYKLGRTPNPDVLCNKYMKFGYLWKEAERLGCIGIATGHYARAKIDWRGYTHLLTGKDKNKDQSYFLCQLNQDQLKNVLFPIGHLNKGRVRKIAKKAGLHIAEKKDSQGICFVGKVQMMDFLKERIPEQIGNIVTPSGEILGTHQGFAYYTVGQRTGLGLSGGPWFVLERRADSNEVVVVKDDDEKLLTSKIDAVDISETLQGNLKKVIGKKITARIRYRQKLQKCRIISISEKVITTHFDSAQKAVAPGQFIAWYKGEELVGSGVIEKAIK